MENQVLRRLRGLILWGAVLLLWCQVTGCAGSISGKVFLDQNGNGVMDPSESGVPQVKMSILYKGKSEKTGYTNYDGKFYIKSKWRKGSVCVRIEEEVLASVVAGSNLASSVLMPAKTFAAATTTTTTENECTNGADANRNGICDDKEDDTAENSDGGTDVDTTGKEEETAPGWSNDVYCGSLKNGYLELFVPLPIDFEKAIEDIPELDRQSFYAGETFTQKITKPTICDLKPIQLPSGISLVEGGNPNISVDPNTSLLVFPSASASRTFRPTVKAAVTTTSALSPLDHVDLMLKVDENISTTAKDVSIKPVALCETRPYELPEIKYSIKRDIDLILQNKISEVNHVPATANGDTFVVVLKIRNIGKSPVGRGELVISASDGLRLEGIPDVNCSDLGQRASCQVTNLAPGDVTIPLEFTFRVPSSRAITVSTHYTITSTFKIEGIDTEIEAEHPIEFNLQP